MQCLLVPQELRLIARRAQAERSTGFHIRHSLANTVGISADNAPSSSTPQHQSSRTFVTPVSQTIRVGDPVLAPESSFYEYIQGNGRQKLQTHANHAAMQFFIAAGIPPSALDHPEFAKLYALLNSSYKPLTRAKLTEILIPTEQAFIQTLQIEFLRTQQYITITFDGGTTSRQDGFYTIHACLADGKELLLEMVNGRGFSHTGEWIKGHLLRVRRV